jgi:hypothetical protein
VGAALVYSPVAGYIGDDQFSYTIQDAMGAMVVGYVNLLTLLSPVSQSVPPGLAASFGIGLTNPPPGYSFQWQVNGTPVAGATLGELTITNAQVANAGSYTLVVTDPHGVAWPSPTATLIVQAYAPYQLTIASITDSSEQSAYPAANAVDGDTTTFWVSSGTAAGQGPSPTNPEWLLVTFSQQVALAEFLVYPRANYGPSNMQMIVNGTVVYTGTMANSATPLDVKLSPPVYATNAQLYITSSYDTAYPSRNVQVSELVFLERAQPGTFGDWELGYFNDAQINNPAVAGIGADPDGDRVVNLLEFVVGGNPMVPDATNAVMAGISLPGNQIAVQFQERNHLGEVTRGFVASPDFTTWTNVTPVSVTLVQTLGNISTYQAVFPVQKAPLYYRLNYSLSNWQRY